jgi:urease accessory protein
MDSQQSLGRMLQLGSANLPVGAFAYSEGLETLVQQDRLRTPVDLRGWLEDHLRCGPVRMETAIFQRLMTATTRWQPATLIYWDGWLTASRESEELALQNRQMARSLWRLLQDLMETQTLPLASSPQQYVTAFAIASALAGVSQHEAMFTYVHAWLSNLIVAAVRLIPLGQSAGQKLLWDLQDSIAQLVDFAQNAQENELYCWSTGITLASMQHETLYSRLYRS